MKTGPTSKVTRLSELYFFMINEDFKAHLIIYVHWEAEIQPPAVKNKQNTSSFGENIYQTTQILKVITSINILMVVKILTFDIISQIKILKW